MFSVSKSSRWEKGQLPSLVPHHHLGAGTAAPDGPLADSGELGATVQPSAPCTQPTAEPYSMDAPPSPADHRICPLFSGVNRCNPGS